MEQVARHERPAEAAAANDNDDALDRIYAALEAALDRCEANERAHEASLAVAAAGPNWADLARATALATAPGDWHAVALAKQVSDFAAAQIHARVTAAVRRGDAAGIRRVASLARRIVARHRAMAPRGVRRWTPARGHRHVGGLAARTRSIDDPDAPAVARERACAEGGAS